MARRLSSSKWRAWPPSSSGTSRSRPRRTSAATGGSGRPRRLGAARGRATERLGDARKLAELLGTWWTTWRTSTSAARLRLERVRTMTQGLASGTAMRAPSCARSSTRTRARSRPRCCWPGSWSATGRATTSPSSLARQIDAAKDRATRRPSRRCALRLGGLLEETDRIQARNVYYAGLDWEPKSRGLLDALARMLGREGRSERAGRPARAAARDGGGAGRRADCALQPGRAPPGARRRGGCRARPRAGVPGEPGEHAAARPPRGHLPSARPVAQAGGALGAGRGLSRRSGSTDRPAARGRDAAPGAAAGRARAPATPCDSRSRPRRTTSKSWASSSRRLWLRATRKARCASCPRSWTEASSPTRRAPPCSRAAATFAPRRGTERRARGHGGGVRDRPRNVRRGPGRAAHAFAGERPAAGDAAAERLVRLRAAQVLPYAGHVDEARDDPRAI